MLSSVAKKKLASFKAFWSIIFATLLLDDVQKAFPKTGGLCNAAGGLIIKHLYGDKK